MSNLLSIFAVSLGLMVVCIISLVIVYLIRSAVYETIQMIRNRKWIEKEQRLRSALGDIMRWCSPEYPEVVRTLELISTGLSQDNYWTGSSLRQDLRNKFPVTVYTLRKVAERYMEAVEKLGEQSGYNKQTYFESPILTMPTPAMGKEAMKRWKELNDSGVLLKKLIGKNNA